MVLHMFRKQDMSKIKICSIFDCYVLFKLKSIPPYLPYKVKMQYVHFRLHTNYFLLPWKILKKLVDDQWSSITKGSIYHIYHYVHTTFYHWMDWPEIGCFNGSISIMFDICTYCVFILYSSCMIDNALYFITQHMKFICFSNRIV